MILILVNVNSFRVGQRMKIKKSSFHRHCLKGEGYSFKKPKVKFGAFDDISREKSRMMNGIVLLNLALKEEPLFFYDETIFTLGTFARKGWWKKNVQATIRFRRPTLMLRLNMIMSQHSIIAFELSDTKHKQEDVIRFLKTVSVKIREENQISGPPVIVMDNGPKNRSRMIWQLASEGHFTPFFTTPCSPEQNCIEQFFGFSKKQFAALRTLNAINSASDSYRIFARAVVHAISEAAKKDLNQVRSRFFNELSGRISSFNFNQ